LERLVDEIRFGVIVNLDFRGASLATEPLPDSECQSPVETGAHGGIVGLHHGGLEYLGQLPPARAMGGAAYV
jgi:hypothetical protein